MSVLVDILIEIIEGLVKMTLIESYRQCPHCKEIAFRNEMNSGNSRNARFWTDLYYEGSMMLKYEKFVVCPYCEQLIWDVDYKVQDGISKELPYIISPNLRDLRRALKTFQLDADQEIYIRMEYWQLSNHKRRDFSKKYRSQDKEIRRLLKNLECLSKSSSKSRDADMKVTEESLLSLNNEKKERNVYWKYQLTEDEKDNLTKLLSIISKHNSTSELHRYLRAEISRELSLFDQCIRLCDDYFNEAKNNVRFIQELAWLKKPFVEEIKMATQN